MRVICIDANGVGDVKPTIQEGVIYTVMNKAILCGEDAVQLKEMPIGDNGAYHYWSSSRFTPLSEIDECNLSHAEPIESTFTLKEV